MKKRVLLIPFLLIPSTAIVFAAFSQILGPNLGYVLGFIFYWFVWCLVVPISLLGRSAVSGLFKEENPLFRRANILPAILLIIIVLVTVIMYPPTQLVVLPGALLIIAVPVAVVNGVCEELLWRGVYMRSFPGNFTLAVIYPSAGFALSHISPQLVYPDEGGVWPFVASTLFLGIGYGWITYRTRSVRWPAISHSLGGILSAGGAIAPSIYALFTP